MSDVRLDGQPAPPFVPGYRLERRLGAGGMGAVWVGVEERTGVRRAVKVLGAGADVEMRLRFMREAEAMARVDDHPGVVRVHAAGGGASGAWLVMDLAAGGDLEGRLRRGPLAPDAALTLGRALAHALAHVHARGVLHRDLKPANVLFDEHGAPKLVDFGLARLQGAERLSLSGALLGTPVYMAPEQAQGLPVDERADVYGLGAVLYHALTGRAPVRSGPLLSVLAQVIERTPTPPSATSPGTSPAFEAAVLRALAKAPEERFPTAAAFAAALDHAALHPGVRPRPRVPPALVVTAALAVALAAAAILGAARRTTPSPPTPTSAAAPETTAGRPANLATDALRRAVLDDDPRRGLDLLAEARDAANHDVLAWAAALAFLAEDAAAAARWAERSEARGRAGTWLRTVARALSPAASGEDAVVEGERELRDLRDLLAARAAAREWTFSVFQGATRELLEEAVAPLSGLIDVARRAGASAPPPVRLALGVYAQRALCERRADLLNLVATAADHADRRPVALRALAAARDLAPGSRPALGLWTLAAAASTTRLGRESGEAPAPDDPGLVAAVDALPTDGPYAWVRGLHGAVWLAGVQDPDPHETEQRWAIVEAHLPKVSDARSATTPAAQRVQELASRARITVASARVHEAWSVAHRGADDRPAREAALAMIREVHDPSRTWLAAQVHLLAGEPTRARALLLALPDKGREHEFTAGLLVECGLQEGRADAIEAGLALLSPRPRARLEEHGVHALWTAVACARRGDVAAARAALESTRGRDTTLGVSVPWRTPAETRRQVDAIAAGTWRPGPGARPFVPRR